MKNDDQKKGFTLIEVMITVVIVAILASIIVPSYQNAIRKSKRQIAISDMLLYKQAEERYRSNNLVYATLDNLIGVYAVNKSSLTTDYLFSIDDVTGINYRIVATPQNSQAMGSETICNPLTITGDDLHGSNPTCWAK